MVFDGRRLTVTDSNGKNFPLSDLQVYYRMSDELFAKMKSVSDDSSTSLQQKYVASGPERTLDGIPWILGYLHFLPTNNRLSWMKLPWPATTQVQIEDVVNRYESLPYLHFETGIRGEPSGTFGAAMDEFQRNVQSLGSGTLPETELMNLILEASQEFQNPSESISN